MAPEVSNLNLNIYLLEIRRIFFRKKPWSGWNIDQGSSRPWNESLGMVGSKTMFVSPEKRLGPERVNHPEKETHLPKFAGFPNMSFGGSMVLIVFFL